MRLENKVAIVTASTRGIGAAIAETFAKEGARIYLAARNEERAATFANRLKENGGHGFLCIQRCLQAGNLPFYDRGSHPKGRPHRYFSQQLRRIKSSERSGYPAYGLSRIHPDPGQKYREVSFSLPKPPFPTWQKTAEAALSIFLLLAGLFLIFLRSLTVPVRPRSIISPN